MMNTIRTGRTGLAATGRRSGLVIAVVVAGLVGYCGTSALCPQRADAEEPHGAKFLEEHPLTIAIPTASTASAQLGTISLVNASDRQITITLVLAGADLEKVVTALNVTVPDAGPTPTAVPSPVSAIAGARSSSLEPGAIWRTEVTLTLNGNVTGTASGKLMALGSDGSIARRDLSLVRPAPAPTFPVERRLLSRPLADALTLDAIRWCGPLDGDATATLKFEPVVGQTLIPSGLADDSGHLASVSIDDVGTLTAKAPLAGAFKGVLARPPEGSETTDQKLASLAMNVRDGPFLAMLLLVIGLVAAFLVEWLTTDTLPRLDLMKRLGSTRTDATKLRDDHQKWIGEQGAWPSQVSKTAPDIDGLLVEAATIARTDFDLTPALDKRVARWSNGGSEYQKIADYLATYAAILATRASIVKRWTELLPLRRDPLDLPFDRSVLMHRLRTAFTDAPSNAARLGTLKADLSAIDLELQSCQNVAAFLQSLSTSADPAEVLKLFRNLAWVAGIPAGVDEVLKDAMVLAKASPNGATGKLAQGKPTISAALVVAASSSPAAGLPELEPGAVGGALRTWNALFMVLVAAVVFAVGLSTQYLSSRTFGSPADYLTILTWGFVGGSAAQLVKIAAGSLVPLVRTKR